eukprot:GHVU01121335.1.p1 GENE.GHVU01121335.1~~GHVU01121335.1.p1  ORF type:complete len:204 (-),score=31.40 GHVU01121335.1:284-895(-)
MLALWDPRRKGVLCSGAMKGYGCAGLRSAEDAAGAVGGLFALMHSLPVGADSTTPDVARTAAAADSGATGAGAAASGKPAARREKGSGSSHSSSDSDSDSSSSSGRAKEARKENAEEASSPPTPAGGAGLESGPRVGPPGGAPAHWIVARVVGASREDPTARPCGPGLGGGGRHASFRFAPLLELTEPIDCFDADPTGRQVGK